MKPKRPHPLYHFDPEFKPRPKLVEPRGFNWPMVVGILLSAVIVFGSVALAVHFAWRVCR